MRGRQLRDVDLRALEVMEGKVAYVYDDAVYPTRMYKQGQKVKGTLTAGVGHTGSDLAQWIGKTIPEEQIKKWLDHDTDAAERFVETAITVPLNDNEFAALSFWVFNIGVGAAGSSTLVKKLNAGDYDSVPAQLRRWTKTTINGKRVTSNGLIKRRADEVTYWLADEKRVAPRPVSRPETEPTGTQVGELETPSVVNKENISWATTVIGGFIERATAPPYSYVVAGIIAVSFCVGVYLFVAKRVFPK